MNTINIPPSSTPNTFQASSSRTQSSAVDNIKYRKHSQICSNRLGVNLAKKFENNVTRSNVNPDVSASSTPELEINDLFSDFDDSSTKGTLLLSHALYFHNHLSC